MTGAIAAWVLTLSLIASVSQPAPTPPATAHHAPEHRRAVSGGATWFRAPHGTAAAGPALRRALGRGWRGTVVEVCASGRCIRVRLADWCACGPRHGVPTLLDLSADSFARLAPLGRGVLRVTVALP